MAFGFWIDLALWAVTGVLAGVAYLTVVPWVAARVGGLRARERVSYWYVWAAQTFTERAGVIVRDEELSLVRKHWDGEYSADKDTASGETRHHYDVFSVLDRLRGRIFGFGLSDRGVWVSPLLAEIGAKAHTMRQNNDIGPETRAVERDGRTVREQVMQDGIPIPDRSQLVDLSAARHLVKGSADPNAGQDAYKRTKISQEPFTQTVSPAQGLLIVGGFLAGLAVVMFLSGDSGSSAPVAPPNATNQTVLSGLGALIMARLNQVRQGIAAAIARISGGSGDRDWGRVGRGLAAAAIGVVGLVLIPAIAVVTFGPVMAIIAGMLQLLTIIAIPFGIWLLGPALPGLLAVPLATISWILAQLTTDGGVIVERKTGVLEYHELRKREHGGFETTLSDGTVLPIDGTEGDLYRFAWNDLGIVAEKTEENMQRLTAGETLRADGGEIVAKNTRAGYRPIINTGSVSDWVVSLPHLESWAEGSATGNSIRTGRQKALRENGGEQGLSQLVFTVLLLVAPVLGAAMGWVIA